MILFCHVSHHVKRARTLLKFSIAKQPDLCNPHSDQTLERRSLNIVFGKGWKIPKDLVPTVEERGGPGSLERGCHRRGGSDVGRMEKGTGRSRSCADSTSWDRKRTPCSPRPRSRSPCRGSPAHPPRTQRRSHCNHCQLPPHPHHHHQSHFGPVFH